MLSTAHPAKFSEAVTSSLVSAGATFDFEADVLPPEMRGLLQKERRVIDVRVGPKAGLDGLIDKTKEVIERASATGAARAGAKGTESM